MKPFATILLLLIYTYVYAQPVITTSWAPKVDDVVRSLSNFSEDMTISSGDSGANVEWDFGSVVGQGDNNLWEQIFVEPSESNFGDLFPEADLAKLPLHPGPIYFTLFYEVDDEEYKQVGFGLEGDLPASNVYLDPSTLMKFPFEFEDSFTDEFATESITVDGGTESFITSSSVVTADAYGTLITPLDSYTDVIRVKLESVSRDSMVRPVSAYNPAGSYTINETHFTTYEWYKNSLNPLVIHRTTSSVVTQYIPGEDPIVEFSSDGFDFFWYAYEETISKVERDLSEMEILRSGPNPTQGDFEITMNSNNAKQVTIDVYNALGFPVMHAKQSLMPGRNIITTNLETLPSGHYILQLKDKSSLQSFKVVKVE